MDIPNEKLAFTIAEWMEATGHSRSAVYNEIAKGLLKAKKRGRNTIILRADGLAYLNALPDFISGIDQP